MFIDWECGNLKVNVDGGTLLEIILATGSQTFYKPVKVYSVTNAIGEIGVSMIFLLVTFICG